MSWLSQFIHNPGQFITHEPLKALGLLAAPLGLAAAPFLAPELAAGAGLFGAAEGAAGAGAGALGFAGAEAGAGALGLEGLAGAEAGGSSLAELLEGSGGPFAGLGGGEGFGGGAMGFAEAAPGTNSAYVADAFSALGGATPGEGLPGGPGFGGEAAPFGGASPADAAAAGSTGPGVTAGGADPAAAGEQGFWDKLVGKSQESFWKNPLGVGAAGLGLGYNMLQGSKMSPEMKAMEGQAAQLNQQQAQLMSYLQKGTLPPGLQQAVQNASAAAKANAISNAAKNGQSTDPTQNTALAGALAGVDRNMIALIAQQGVALMNSGLQAAGISSQLYAMLEKINQQHAQSTGQAIANFAVALSGGPKINVIGGSGMGMAA